MLKVKENHSVANKEVLKSYEHKGTFKTAKTIIEHRGIMGLYSGYRFHLRKRRDSAAEWAATNLPPVRDTIGTGIYFMTYESIKQLTATFQGSSSPTSPGPVAVAGGLCGLLGWAAVGSSIPPQPQIHKRG